ncbi:MAG: nucleoside phosphorylase [Actinomycetota bacterium]|nr:nucleoside phosphorylase [Actinomycetota bacterium]MDH5312988.1 nucleoside phosphorylase [Actinomycetota bacterium]
MSDDALGAIEDAPILEFDPAPTAVIEPSEVIEPMSIAPHAVLCFFQDVIADVVERHGGRTVDHVVSEIGRNPIYEIDHDGRRVVVMHPGVGAPLAAGFLEELIARGCRSFVACGGAGVLVPDVALGHVIVPTSAVRDEGTSYHYMPPSRTVEPAATAVDAIVAVAERHGVPHVTGATWTSDALYRETRRKVDDRVAQGCLTVEMEAAAFFAVAAFRGVTFGQVLYAGDDLSGDTWDQRGWNDHTSGRETLFRIAAEAVLTLPPDPFPTIGRQG